MYADNFYDGLIVGPVVSKVGSVVSKVGSVVSKVGPVVSFKQVCRSVS